MNKYWKFNKKQIKNIAKLYIEGYSANDLAIKYNSNIHTILQYLKRNGVKIRTFKHSNKTKEKIRKKLFKRKTKVDVYNAILSGDIYSWKRWLNFKKIILQRDNYTCQICKKKKKRLFGHHKKSRIKYPKLFWHKNNITIVCAGCHIRLHAVNVFNTLNKKIKNLEKKLKIWKLLAMRDSLTGLWNERKLKKDTKRYLEIQKRSKVKFIVALIDIDNFKQYNDKHGHEYGNKILIQTAKILQNSVRRYEKVYRLGGGADEFVLILSHSNNPLIVIERVIGRLCDKNINCSAGFGILDKKILEIIDKRMYNDKRRKK